MGLLHFMAIRAFGEGWRGQMIMRPPVILASFRMPPFWIGHANSSFDRAVSARFYGFSTLIAIAF
jgi:hypothetical protein